MSPANRLLGRIPVAFTLLLLGVHCAPAPALQDTERASRFSWTYYRPTNTGIQGDACEALVVGADGKPWIAGYDASFEEGGFSQFDPLTNRWKNFSNVDHRVIGHPALTGISRISDIAVDARGHFWMATGRGGLLFKPSQGASSLVRFGQDNSPIHGGWNRGVEIAPDGSVWFASYSTVWGTGGISRYSPGTGKWQIFDNVGDSTLTIQPQPNGQYIVWSNVGYQAICYHSETKTWETLPVELDMPAFLVGKNATDPQGNTWMFRWTDPEQFGMQFDCLRPDGSWFRFPVPPFGTSVAEVRAKSPTLVLVADGSGGAWRFDGKQWHALGKWESTPHTYGIDQDAAGNVWMCGIGGAGRRDAVTGKWQRYRITNSSQYDFFNQDLTINREGVVYATANAGPGVGGLVKFEEGRWTGLNILHYGLGEDWPFLGDNGQRVYLRPRSGQLLVNPMYEGLHRKSDQTWIDLNVGIDTISAMHDDSLGRLWVAYPGKLLLRKNNAWQTISDIGGDVIRVDRKKEGWIWAMGASTILTTDGTNHRSWSIEDFPGLDPQSDQFKGMVAANDGSIWIGANTVNLPDNSTVIRLDPARNRFRIYRYRKNWPFPGQYVRPVAATSDGRIWFQYDSDFGIDDQGLFAFDGSRTIKFPAPFEGRPQWSGLPHAAILDVEQRKTEKGYDLWISCASRGIAVLHVDLRRP